MHITLLHCAGCPSFEPSGCSVDGATGCHSVARLLVAKPADMARTSPPGRESGQHARRGLGDLAPDSGWKRVEHRIDALGAGPENGIRHARPVRGQPQRHLAPAPAADQKRLVLQPVGDSDRPGMAQAENAGQFVDRDTRPSVQRCERGPSRSPQAGAPGGHLVKAVTDGRAHRRYQIGVACHVREAYIAAVRC
jgi:hypothetical protein